MLRKIALTTSLAAALVLTGVAFAGNGAGPNKTSASSISPPIVMSAAATTAAPASTTAPHYGDLITFDVSTTATTTPFVNLKCYQNGALVAQGWDTFFTGGSPGSFGLASPLWKSGAADCTADLGMYLNNGKWNVLAATRFHVDA